MAVHTGHVITSVGSITDKMHYTLQHLNLNFSEGDLAGPDCVCVCVCEACGTTWGIHQCVAQQS